jgi:ectoine hydroxylase-related dioxygenase (phytanoyl-CoA dioxygenase family)
VDAAPTLPAALDEHGYAIVETVLAAAEVDDLRAALGEIPQGGRQGGLRDALSQVPAVLRCARDPRIVGLAEAMLGAGARPVKGIVFDKTPAANWKVPWHQDLTICVQRRLDVAGFGPWSEKEGILHVQPPVEVLERILALRIHLDDAGPDNGALRVLPGTHRSGRLGEAEIERLRGEVPEVVCDVPAGGVMLMRPLLLHASSPCHRPAHRRVLHIEYSASPLPGGLAWRE